MNRQTMQIAVVAVLAMVVGISCTMKKQDRSSGKTDRTRLDQLVGQPVDISPWAYVWRADCAVQEKPEAYFIPHRLERINTVYRTAYYELSQEELKSPFYNQPDLLKPLPPQPKGQLLTGLLWVGGLSNYQVELHWPTNDQVIPSQEAIEVRVYPTSWGWFGWTVDKILSNPVISADRRTWIYKSEPNAKMDWAYSTQVDAATEMVAVFREKGVESPMPAIRVTSPTMGEWQQMNVEIEWGFQAGTEKTSFDGRVETRVAMTTGPISPLADDKGTIVAGDGHSWQSQAVGTARRGIIIPLLCTSKGRPGLDSRVTVWTKTSGFTFRVADLDNGPIFIPEHGVFVTKAGSGQTARQFVQELAARNLKTVRQMTREHREAASWDEVLQQVRLWSCPEGTAVPPFPAVNDPAVQVQVPDQRWTDAWRLATDQLRGKHLWPQLGHEIGRAARAMELVGLHSEACGIYNYFLPSPGVKSEGDYLDADGSLEWARGMRHDMGYIHEGTHASTGRLLYAMTERYFLTGDKEWFQQNRVRLQTAADWIIRQRKLYMINIPNREDLFVAGLMPPCMAGDYALPSSDWHWYYFDNALSVQGLRRFADVLMEIDPEAGRKYRQEAQAFYKDTRRAVEKEVSLAPVRLGKDGTYRSYIPRMAYAGGVPGPEFGAPQFPDMDIFWGSLMLAEPLAILDANDFRVVDTLNVMEEMGTSDSAVLRLQEARKKKGLSTDDAWFWLAYSCLPKVSHNSNIYLLQDDVPNFLRFWMNSYAVMVGANGKLWEGWHLNQYENCDIPDTMTAGWFIENFRNLLMMEDNQSLWIARGTPRAWLEQGKQITVKNAPTYFGTLAYEITSDVNNGKITAAIDIPSRNPVKSVLVRFRHPQTMPIQSVTVNGQPWTGFNPDKEVIELVGLTGKVVVIAKY